HNHLFNISKYKKSQREFVTKLSEKKLSVLIPQCKFGYRLIRIHDKAQKPRLILAALPKGRPDILSRIGNRDPKASGIKLWWICEQHINGTLFKLGATCSNIQGNKRYLFGKNVVIGSNTLPY